MAGYTPYWQKSETEGKSLVRGDGTALSPYVADNEDLDTLIAQASEDVPRVSESREEDSDGPRRRRRRRSSGGRHLPTTIFLTAGHYRLSRGLDNRAALNIIGTGFSGTPNAVIEIDGEVVSHGNKSWQGVIFEDGRYVIDAPSPDGDEKFVNCIFRSGARVEVRGGRAIFNNCRIIVESPPSPSRLGGRYSSTSEDTEGDGTNWLTQENDSSIEAVQCEFEVDGSGDKRVGSLMRLLGSSTRPNVINNSRISVSVKSRAESFSRAFYVIHLGSTQLLEFTNNQVTFSSTNNRIFFFGGWERVSGIHLSATNNTYTNNTPGSLFVALIGGLWSAASSANPFGSIYISRSTLRNVRLISFNTGLCNHERLCAQKETCEHRTYDFSYWDQTITVTFTDVFLLTPSVDQRSAIIDINGPAGTNWTLNLSNNNFVVNNGNIPILIAGVQAATINLSSTTITSTATNPPGAPGGTTPFLVVDRVTGVVRLVTTPGTSIVGSNLSNPVITGTSSTTGTIVVETGRQISTQ